MVLAYANMSFVKVTGVPFDLQIYGSRTEESTLKAVYEAVLFQKVHFT